MNQITQVTTNPGGAATGQGGAHRMRGVAMTPSDPGTGRKYNGLRLISQPAYSNQPDSPPIDK